MPLPALPPYIIEPVWERFSAEEISWKGTRAHCSPVSILSMTNPEFQIVVPGYRQTTFNPVFREAFNVPKQSFQMFLSGFNKPSCKTWA
jgi:hypothetical protein